MTGKMFIDQFSNGTSFIDEQQGDAMSDIQRWRTNWATRRDDNGHLVLYSDHAAEVERLTRERDEAQAEVDRLKTQMAQAVEDLSEARVVIIRAMRRMPDGTMRAAAAIKAQETEDTP